MSSGLFPFIKTGSTSTVSPSTTTKSGATSTVSPSTTTTKSGTTSTVSPTTTTTTAECSKVFNKAMENLDNSMRNLDDTMNNMKVFQSTLVGTYDLFKQYTNTKLGCIPFKGGKFSRKNSSKKHKSHTRKWRV